MRLRSHERYDEDVTKSDVGKAMGVEEFQRSAAGQRFEFGKNWKGFLEKLNDERISTFKHVY